MDTTVVTLISLGISLLSVIMHGLPAKVPAANPAAPSVSANPANPAALTPVDAFANLSLGLPGHPLLNALFSHQQSLASNNVLQGMANALMSTAPSASPATAAPITPK
jgi:hypothetical protein